jgi:hypothetical protein
MSYVLCLTIKMKIVMYAALRSGAQSMRKILLGAFKTGFTQFLQLIIHVSYEMCV